MVRQAGRRSSRAATRVSCCPAISLLLRLASGRTDFGRHRQSIQSVIGWANQVIVRFNFRVKSGRRADRYLPRQISLRHQYRLTAGAGASTCPIGGTRSVGVEGAMSSVGIEGDFSVAGETRVIVPTGMLGAGVSRHQVRAGVAAGAHAIAADSGSTDSGPSYLARGVGKMNRELIKRDLEVLISEAHLAGIPLLIGSCGTSGTRLRCRLDSRYRRRGRARTGHHAAHRAALQRAVARRRSRRKCSRGQCAPCRRAASLSPRR